MVQDNGTLILKSSAFSDLRLTFRDRSTQGTALVLESLLGISIAVHLSQANLQLGNGICFGVRL